MVEQMPGGMLVLPLGSAARVHDDWLRYRQSILEVRFLSDAKIRKLWKAGYTPADVAADRHHELFPSLARRQIVEKQKLRRQAALERAKAGEAVRGMRRGRTMNKAGIDLRVARAVRDELQAICGWHRLEPEALAYARGMLERVKERIAAIEAERKKK